MLVVMQIAPFVIWMEYKTIRSARIFETRFWVSDLLQVVNGTLRNSPNSNAPLPSIILP
jgi:hypothetical protein